MSPQKYTDDDWLTPPGLLDLFGPFDLDPCSPISRPWDTAKQHFNIVDDGLKQPWAGRVWLNPPYSCVEPWITKASKHANGLALVNARTETKWFFNGIWDTAFAVFFLKGRIRFFRPDGTQGGMGRSASAIAAFTQTDAGILYRAGLEGRFVPLIVSLREEFKTSWRRLVRFFLRQCDGVASLEQLYGLAMGHPKTQANSNWKAKIRQQVQKEAVRVADGIWRLNPA